MQIGRAIRRRAKAAAPPVLFLALTGYFCWNAATGELGLKTRAMRERQLVAETATRAAAEAEQALWERRVDGLRGSHLDADMLDERARAMLNLAAPDEIVVPYPRDKPLYQ